MTESPQEPVEERPAPRGKALEELRRQQELYPSLYEEAMRHLREQEEKQEHEDED